ncbi:MAG: LexA repressor [Parcubacteria group bacterium GW2011_GWC2_42_12]|uniref:Repressor LexA n=2 Tax=Candidatus Falkowiibacteriota TaxID=1752728 RepID=A0A1F5S6J6_9BACT|nr:MAG: LexA repressor [Candidatus Falkowbacteria bacterium GW2011_GWA2_41_14]KKS34331.1 MAG: LexA repressor [Parcubacteria group bacterium GW2011_GWC2_42_12]OGF22340.1 MAG: repressor LexA [Candidatus Falkowbacteria bacterium RIFCSPHIGHO2_02_FULL_42_9]
MIKNITKRQLEALNIIYKNIESSGFPPSLADLREELKVASNQSVINFLKVLENSGYIKREEGLARGLKILPKGYKALGVDMLVPAVGNSSCGPFVEAIQEVGNWISLPGEMYKDEVTESKDKLFIIKVGGDSMINAGINNGDLLLIKQAREFKNGDIVVARNDDGTTVKRFVAENKKAYLKPENPAYKNIPIFEDTYFDGKVIANLSTLKRTYEPKN